MKQKLQNADNNTAQVAVRGRAPGRKLDVLAAPKEDRFSNTRYNYAIFDPHNIGMTIETKQCGAIGPSQLNWPY